MREAGPSGSPWARRAIWHISSPTLGIWRQTSNELWANPKGPQKACGGVARTQSQYIRLASCLYFAEDPAYAIQTSSLNSLEVGGWTLLIYALH
jgi:hypothetical protein